MSTEDDPPPPPEPPPPAYEPAEVTPSMPYDAAAMPPPPPMPPPDEQLLPHDASLADAVGAPSPAALRRKARDEGDLDPDAPRPRGRRTTLIVGASIVGALAIGALAFLGHANAERYLITCAASTVTPEQGRSFPPWGTHAMAGAEWKPVALPPNAECKPRETDDADQLAGWYLDILLDRASSTLSAKNPLEIPGPDPKTSSLDVATEQLNQALLLARSPARRDQRKEVERLLGDIDYWHASVRLRDASATLLDAAKQFETAAAKRPRHVTDAGAWATFLHHLADELHQGPNAAPPATAAPVAAPVAAPTAAEPTAPMGSALPVEPDEAGSAAPPQAPVAAGGVLL